MDDLLQTKDIFESMGWLCTPKKYGFDELGQKKNLLYSKAFDCIKGKQQVELYKNNDHVKARFNYKTYIMAGETPVEFYELVVNRMNKGDLV